MAVLVAIGISLTKQLGLRLMAWDGYDLSHRQVIRSGVRIAVASRTFSRHPSTLRRRGHHGSRRGAQIHGNLWSLWLQLVVVSRLWWAFRLFSAFQHSLTDPCLHEH